MTPHEVIGKINPSIVPDDLPAAEKALEEIIGEAFDAGFNRGFDQQFVVIDEGNYYHDKETYLKLLFTNQKQNEGV